jgi:hypothetical protein
MEVVLSFAAQLQNLRVGLVEKQGAMFALREHAIVRFRHAHAA